MILILIVVLSESVQGQSDSTLCRHSVKTNALQWIVNEPNIIYEYRINENIGIEITIGTFLHVETREFVWYGHLQNAGLVCRINPKFYILHDKKFYISPMILLKNTSYTGILGSEGTTFIFSSHYDTRTDAKETNKVLGIGSLVGYQIFLSKSVFLDLYGGLTFRHNQYEVTHYRSIGNAQDGPCENGYPCSFSYKNQKIMPQGGLKLGYAFKPVN